MVCQPVYNNLHPDAIARLLGGIASILKPFWISLHSPSAARPKPSRVLGGRVRVTPMAGAETLSATWYGLLDPHLGVTISNDL